jgi:predicted DCC family thiol-disulfide oxidoreductase YuxK
MRMDASSRFVAPLERRPTLPRVTTPAPLTVLFDGGCRLCTRSAQMIQRVFGRDRVALRDFQQSGALDPYPTVTAEAATKKMHVVMPDGRVFAGAEAFARILANVRILGWSAWLYYVPGVRQFADVVYALVAKYRYRLFGRNDSCEGGTCGVHGI